MKCGPEVSALRTSGTHTGRRSRPCYLTVATLLNHLREKVHN
nr:MAG TPA: hypothetical protein [Inoviridae sp.]